jgi:hypothetical protein
LYLNTDGSIENVASYNFNSQTGAVGTAGITWDNGFLPLYIYVVNSNGGNNASTVMILNWSNGVPTFKSVFTPKGNSLNNLRTFSKSYGTSTTLVYLAEGSDVCVFKQGIGTLTELPTSPYGDPNASNYTSLIADPVAVNYQ